MTVWSALLFVALGTVLLLLSEFLRRRSRMPRGAVIWDDGPHHGRVPEPLYDPQLNLIGRPDYVIRDRSHLIPVEVKARKAPREPFRGHVLQAAAYCWLVEKVLGQRPELAVLRYSDRSFEIRYSRRLERELVIAVGELHSLRGTFPERSHESRARCDACGFLAICDQALT